MHKSAALSCFERFGPSSIVCHQCEFRGLAVGSPNRVTKHVLSLTDQKARTKKSCHQLGARRQYGISFLIKFLISIRGITLPSRDITVVVINIRILKFRMGLFNDDRLAGQFKLWMDLNLDLEPPLTWPTQISDGAHWASPLVCRRL
jgi:hypothetical protein